MCTDEEEGEEKEDENHGNSIDRFILLDQKDMNLVTTEDTITSILPSLPAKTNNASPSKIYTEAGFDKQLFQFPLIPVLIVTSSLAVTILVYISVVICGRFQNKRSDSIGSSNSILVPPRTFVNNSFGQDGYFPFRPWLRPSSYNQCFYRSYRHYQKSIPFLFPPGCKNKLSITTNRTVLIPRAHLSPKTGQQKSKA
jgi:hypothetical protein